MGNAIGRNSGRAFMTPNHSGFDIERYNYVADPTVLDHVKLTFFIGNMFTGKTTSVKKYIKDNSKLRPLIINPKDSRDRYLTLKDLRSDVSEPWYNCIILDDLPSHNIDIFLDRYKSLIHAGIEEIIIMTVPFFIKCDLDVIKMNVECLQKIIGNTKASEVKVVKCYLKKVDGPYYNIPCTVKKNGDISFGLVRKVGDISEKSLMRTEEVVRESEEVILENLEEVCKDLIDFKMKHPKYVSIIENYKETVDDSEIIEYDVLSEFDTEEPIVEIEEPVEEMVSDEDIVEESEAIVNDTIEEPEVELVTIVPTPPKIQTDTSIVNPTIVTLNNVFKTEETGHESDILSCLNEPVTEDEAVLIIE